MGLTGPEKRCLDAFRAVLKRLYPINPSVQEVADEMGLTKSACAAHLRSLERKGRVERNGRKSRTLRLAKRRAA